MKLYINSIKYNRSLVDGPGVRTVIFFQGCDLRCKGCQNKSTWDIEKGKEIEVSELVALLKEGTINKKITISGGEPLMQATGLIELVKMLDGFDIALYTGHELCDVPKELLKKIKYIKTGPFVEELKTTVTPYIGSSNQSFQEVDDAEV